MILAIAPADVVLAPGSLNGPITLRVPQLTLLAPAAETIYELVTYPPHFSASPSALKSLHSAFYIISTPMSGRLVCDE